MNKTITLNELAETAHKRSVASGFGVPGMTDTSSPDYAGHALKVHMLMVSELAEACEEVRNKKPSFYFKAKRKGHTGAGPHPDGESIIFTPKAVSYAGLAYCIAVAGEQGYELGDLKPEGEAVELADTLIRIADWFGRHGWDMDAVTQAKMDFNATRAFRHGGKAA